MRLTYLLLGVLCLRGALAAAAGVEAAVTAPRAERWGQALLTLDAVPHSDATSVAAADRLASDVRLAAIDRLSSIGTLEARAAAARLRDEPRGSIEDRLDEAQVLLLTTLEPELSGSMYARLSNALTDRKRAFGEGSQRWRAIQTRMKSIAAGLEGAPAAPEQLYETERWHAKVLGRHRDSPPASAPRTGPSLPLIELASRIKPVATSWDFERRRAASDLWARLVAREDASSAASSLARLWDWLGLGLWRTPSEAAYEVGADATWDSMGGLRKNGDPRRAAEALRRFGAIYIRTFGPEEQSGLPAYLGRLSARRDAVRAASALGVLLARGKHAGLDEEGLAAFADAFLGLPEGLPPLARLRAPDAMKKTVALWDRLGRAKLSSLQRRAVLTQAVTSPALLDSLSPAIIRLMGRDLFGQGDRNLYVVDARAFVDRYAADGLAPLRSALLSGRVGRALFSRYSTTQVIEAALLNDYNAIVAQASDLILLRAGAEDIPAGLTPLASKIELPRVTADSVAERLERAGVPVATEQVRAALTAAGFGEASGLIVPLGLHLATSVYRGSRAVDHPDAAYVTFAVTTALLHYAAKGGEAARWDAHAKEAPALHEYALSALALAARLGHGYFAATRDRHVSLGFSFSQPVRFGDAAMPDYARKRTRVLSPATTPLILLRELQSQQRLETQATQNLLRLFGWIAGGRLSARGLGRALSAVDAQIGQLRDRAGLEPEYFRFAFGFWTSAVRERIRREYRPGNDNKGSLRAAVADSTSDLEVAMRSGQRYYSGKTVRVDSPLKQLGAIPLDYIADEQARRVGTGEDVDLADVTLDALER